ncbi:MAG TPA: DUF2752 domain-containing protein [Planctomycetota bacterium]|nr:DUF2752 domain-containing protein [Planctomycetota bacterium]
MAERRATPARTPLWIPVEQGPVAVWVDRVVAVLVAGFAALWVVTLLRLDPDGRGHGTHEQLGWAPCGWPPAYGMPCPTCGCTTAACHLIHGHFVQAFVVQPFGAMIALFGTALGVHALLCLLRGRSFVDVIVRLPFWRIVFGAMVLMLLAWWYKCAVWT